MAVSEQVKQAVITLADVEAAAQRIEPLAKRTPVATSRLLNEVCGAEVFFKCENLQRGGAFKIRGAMNFLASLSDDERRRGVVTFSSGNHAQAVAMAAAHFGVAATIVMPTDAPKAKLASTKAYGPKIILFDRLKDDREHIAREVAAETQAVVVPSYDHPWIVAGQGTATLELLADVPDLDALVIPIGGGGLLSGALIVKQGKQPALRVFGAEPALADDWHRSLRAGQPVEIPPPLTIADGLRTPIPGKVTFPIVSALSEGVILISEEEIKDAVRWLLTRMKLLTEPSGAVAAAAVIGRKLPPDIRRIGVILSGGNIDFEVLSAICAEAA